MSNQKHPIGQGWANVWFAGRLKFFLYALQATFKIIRAKSNILHEALVYCFEKSAPRAGQKTLAGWIWPTGRTLPTPTIELGKGIVLFG